MVSAGAPRVRVAHACGRLGTDEVVHRCTRLLAGERAGAGSRDAEFIVALGGSHAALLLDNGLPPEQAYWLRVWAARGLLWAGPPADAAALRAALADESWRVREMTCKVVARHTLGDLLDDVAALAADPAPRVRAAAARAVQRIVDAGA